MVTSNLPYYATPFVGRLHEIAEVTNRLHDADCRLLTLVGPGGIGKTRIAVQVALNPMARFTDGVSFVPLQPLNSPDFIASAIAEAVGCQFYSGLDPIQQLLNFFSEKTLLLVLDNFEHLSEGAGLLSKIITAAPQVCILVTSRERLNLVEEWIFEVRALNYPLSETETDIEAYDAVQLFVQHARRVQADFTLTSAQKPAVIRICRMVGGMPLAIELAAAWIRALSSDEISREIKRSLDILESPTRNVAPRHRTMRTAFEPTWARLTQNDQAIFMKLSVFRGGFTREAAEHIAGASLRALLVLVDKSLLRVDANGRYDLHELLRQYGEEQLDTWPEDAVQTRDNHADYYATLLETAWPRLNSSEIKAALTQLDLELENIRTMWNWALHQRNARAIERVLPGLNFFYELRARQQEAEQAYARAVAIFSDSAPESVAIRAKLLARQGGFCHDLGLTDKASVLLLESVEILRGIEAESDLAHALLALGVLYEMIDSDMSVAAGYYQESVAIYKKLGDRWYVANVLVSLVHCYGIQGMFDQAIACGKEGLTLFEELGSSEGIATTYSSLGSTVYQMGAYEQCKTYIEKSLVYFRDSGSFIGLIFSVGIISAACSALGEYDQARRHVLDGLQTYRDSGQVRVDRFTLGLMVMAVRVYLGDGGIEQGYKLMGLVDREFRSFGTHRKFWAWSILDRLDEDLPPNLIAAVERGRSWNLDAAMQTVMDDFSRSLEKNTATPTLAIPSLLTERELEILRLIAEGFSNRDIAENLIFSVGTVKWYVHQIHSKLGVNSRTQAIARARELHLLP